MAHSRLAVLRQRVADCHRVYAQATQDVIATQNELLSATWTAVERGEATWADMYAVAQQLRDGGVGGWTTRWNEIVPVSWQKAQHYAGSPAGPPIPRPPRAPATYLPAAWELTRSPADCGYRASSCPPRGTHVVYELLDEASELLYIGTSIDLAGRLVGHRDKPWHRCTARQAADKIDAAGLEAVAILTRMPPYNKQLRSFGGAGTLIAAAREASIGTPELERVAQELHIEATHQLLADAVQHYVAEKGTTWTKLRRDDPDDARLLMGNTLGSIGTPTSARRLAQILLDREEHTQEPSRPGSG